jgi:hypothetical protein
MSCNCRGRSMTPRWPLAGARRSLPTMRGLPRRRRQGDRAQGAPNLTDAVWLYGGTREAITQTVTYARFGVMPDWNERLSEDQIRAVAFYVHGLGGGE